MSQPAYILTFKKDSPTWNLYQELKRDGVKDPDMDQGYLKANYKNKKDIRSAKTTARSQKRKSWPMP